MYDDTILLSSTDYLVGTFSSQVSRLAYEIALVNGSSSQPAVTDPSLHYHSVDSMWYMGGMQHYEYCTTHVSPAHTMVWLVSPCFPAYLNGERQPCCRHPFFCCVQQCRLFCCAPPCRTSLCWVKPKSRLASTLTAMPCMNSKKA